MASFDNRENRQNPIDWPLLARLAQELYSQTAPDLLVAAWLGVALTKTNGFTGLNDGLRILADLAAGVFAETDASANDLKAQADIIDWFVQKLIQWLDDEPSSAVPPPSILSELNRLETVLLSSRRFVAPGFEALKARLFSGAIPAPPKAVTTGIPLTVPEVAGAEGLDYIRALTRDPAYIPLLKRKKGQGKGKKKAKSWKSFGLDEAGDIFPSPGQSDDDLPKGDKLTGKAEAWIEAAKAEGVSLAGGSNAFSRLALKALGSRLGKKAGSRRELKVYAALLELAPIGPYPAITEAVGPKILAILEKHNVKDYEPRLAERVLYSLMKAALRHVEAEDDPSGGLKSLAELARRELIPLNPNLGLAGLD
jgi:hypothetical protein